MLWCLVWFSVSAQCVQRSKSHRFNVCVCLRGCVCVCVWGVYSYSAPTGATADIKLKDAMWLELIKRGFVVSFCGECWCYLVRKRVHFKKHSSVNKSTGNGCVNELMCLFGGVWNSDTLRHKFRFDELVWRICDHFLLHFNINNPSVCFGLPCKWITANRFPLKVHLNF